MNTTKKIAIIGSGISGLSAAYYLSDNYDITIYEKRNRLGGHSRTIMSHDHEKVPIDTGFIVFNQHNYPLLSDLFNKLNVKIEKSDMSFGCSINSGEYEYALNTLGTTLFNIQNPLDFIRSKTNPFFSFKHYVMLKDIIKFNSFAKKNYSLNDETIYELFKRLNLSDEFIKNYFLPISGAIWSSTPNQMKDTPANFIINFFRNHNLLNITGQHQWYTVVGGSREYVKKLKHYLEQRNVKFELNQKNVNIKNNMVDTSNSNCYYDKIIIATHSDQAIEICEQLSKSQKKGLKLIPYQENEVVLHSDETLMPKNKKCWASWIYQGNNEFKEEKIPLTYWMNKLQNIDTQKQYFVTLNNTNKINPNLILNKTTLSHPVFSQNTLKGQSILNKSQGENNIYITGAYLGNGFHEDGMQSSLKIAKLIRRSF
jgi:predicted NAD/FAD-binding protein